MNNDEVTSGAIFELQKVAYKALSRIDAMLMLLTQNDENAVKLYRCGLLGDKLPLVSALTEIAELLLKLEGKAGATLIGEDGVAADLSEQDMLLVEDFLSRLKAPCTAVIGQPDAVDP